ncbi:MAG: hypothetical protein IJZ88_02620 [Clostridia bacterium]|nr:hypothetical protein [Clostridia bacterium]
MNPSKTTANKIFNDGMKNEEVVFVRGINCTPEFAKAQMQDNILNFLKSYVYLKTLAPIKNS